MGMNAGLLFLTVVAKAQSLIDILPPPRVPPTQAAIARTLADDKGQLATCYERARSRDDTLAGGKIVVRLSIGRSGAVRSMKLTPSPPSIRALNPCFQKAISRWAFPRSPHPYRTEFPLELPSYCAMSLSSAPWSEVWIDDKNTGRHTPFVYDTASTPPSRRDSRAWSTGRRDHCAGPMGARTKEQLVLRPPA
jgi:hypothetical protein